MKNHATYESLLNILQLPSFSDQYTSIYLLMTCKRLKLKNGFCIVKKKKKNYIDLYFTLHQQRLK